MSLWMIGAVTLIYATAALLAAMEKNWPIFIVLLGWSIANIGVLWMGAR